jgi:hypothetical protein
LRDLVSRAYLSSLAGRAVGALNPTFDRAECAALAGCSQSGSMQAIVVLRTQVVRGGCRGASIAKVASCAVSTDNATDTVFTRLALDTLICVGTQIHTLITGRIVGISTRALSLICALDWL